MANNFAHQIEYLSGKGYLNTVDDAVIGGVANTLTGAAYFGGQLGDRLIIGHATAAKMSDTTVGTLYGGIYQYVQTKSGSTTAPARGLAAFFASAADIQTHTVTPDVPTNGGCFAGVYISAPTKGNYCFIQIRGLAGCLFKATSLTRATPAAQDMVYLTSAAATFDQQEDATAVTDAILRRAVGVAAETPVAGSVKLVELWDKFLNV